MTTQPSEAVTRSIETFDIDTVTCTIVEAVAEANGIEPLEMEAMLYDVVDPEALAQVIGAIDGYTVFQLAGCEVVVYGDGRLVATPLVDSGVEHTLRPPTETDQPRSDSRPST